MVLTTRRQARLQEESIIDISTPSPRSLERSQSVSADDESQGASDASSSSSSSSNEGDSRSDDDNDESNSSDRSSDSIGARDEDVDIDAIFAKALKACQAQDEKASAGDKSAFETSDDQIALEERKSIDATRMMDNTSKESARRPDETLDSHFERLKRGDDLGNNKPQTDAQLRRERQREKEKTAGSKWFDMPAFPKKRAPDGSASSIRKGKSEYSSSSSRGPTAEEMTKQIQAIRLRNAMDPKRFYRGGNGVSEKGMPAFAQMGRIISSNTEPASTMSRAERGRTVIDELFKDAQNAAYTKRKFSEQQSRTDVGRSSHISKRKGNNAGKRQRR